MTQPVILLDLDGVIVDSQAFEISVTAKIIAAIAAKRQLDEEAARQTWAGCLREAQSSPRWHDYAFHCSQLELGEVWKIPAHQESESLLSLNARHEQVIGDVKGALVIMLGRLRRD